MKFIFTGVIAGSLLAMSGCGGSDSLKDLGKTLDQIEAKPSGTKVELPEFESYEPFTYKSNDRRAIFNPPISAQVMLEMKRESEKENSLIAPDLDREKDELEHFSISSLKLTGFLSWPGDENIALIQDPEGKVHMVSVGRFVGKNFGEVLSIDNGVVEIREIVSNGSGGWTVRPRTLSISEQ